MCFQRRVTLRLRGRHGRAESFPRACDTQMSGWGWVHEWVNEARRDMSHRTDARETYHYRVSYHWFLNWFDAKMPRYRSFDCFEGLCEWITTIYLARKFTIRTLIFIKRLSIYLLIKRQNLSPFFLVRPIFGPSSSEYQTIESFFSSRLIYIITRAHVYINIQGFLR